MKSREMEPRTRDLLLVPPTTSKSSMFVGGREINKNGASGAMPSAMRACPRRAGWRGGCHPHRSQCKDWEAQP